MTPEERESRKAQAIRLRRAGYSRAQIAKALGMKSGGGSLDGYLKGVPPPEWTKRPNAKDELRETAVRLRRRGWSYGEIQAGLGVSSGSLSLWLRDIPLSEAQRARLAEERRASYARRGEASRAAASSRHQRLAEEAASWIDGISHRELFIAGVVAYWAEGSKTKPWGPRQPAIFINSDPGMIKLFLAWLDLIGVPREARSYRISIHENADIDAATRFWADLVGTRPESLLRPTLKRHNPRTVRKNVDQAYRGCLVVRVKRSTDLSTRIRGWFEAISNSLSMGSPADPRFRGAY